MNSSKNIIVGLGNVLLKDDGIGVWLVWELLKRKLPGNIQVYETGISSFLLFSLVPKSNARILFIDALINGQPPGTVYRINGEHLDLPEKGNPLLSLHQFRFEDILLLLKEQRQTAAWRIFGIEPAVIEHGYGLSRCLEVKSPIILEALLEEIGQFFVPKKNKKKGVRIK